MNSGIVQRVVSFVAVVGILAGCGAQPPLAEPPAGPASGTPTPTTPVITEVPAAAFLQTEDLGNGGSFVQDGLPTWTLLCSGTPLRSDPMQVVRKEIVGTYSFVARYDKINKRVVPDGSVNEVITTYRAGGASVYLDEVRQQLARCARATAEEDFMGTIVAITVEKTVEAEGVAGDDSLIWRHRRSGMYVGNYNESVDLIAVIRLGDVIVLVHIGISPGLPQRDPIDRLAAAAARRATEHLTP